MSVILWWMHVLVESVLVYIFMEQVTGRMIEGKNYDSKALIASITKTMTTCVWIKNFLEIKNVNL